MTPLPPPIVHPPRGSLPVLLSVPHSGRDYPAWLLAMASGGRASLAPLEDPLVDRLIWRAVRLGVGAVIAQAPRAAIDCNRAEDELDPSVVRDLDAPATSARARGGLGIVPGRTTMHGHLWRRPIDRREVSRRIDQAYAPYHQAIADGLDQLLDRFGCALLLDCHSMPPPARGVPAVVIGDRYGRSCEPWVNAEALRLARGLGYETGSNEPFAGGHVIERHGQPKRGVHALQIELDRRVYLDASLSQPGSGFDRASRLFETLATGLGRLLLERRFPAAAE